MSAKKYSIKRDQNVFLSGNKHKNIDDDNDDNDDTTIGVSITQKEESEIEKDNKETQTGTRFLSMKKDFEKDCKGYEYIPATLEPTSRTIAIGDIHGDIDVAVNMLRIGRCIKQVDRNVIDSVILKNKNNVDEYYIWIGKDTQVVQVGDQVDRCRPIGDNSCILPNTTSNDEASDVKILIFYTDLHVIAKKQGGGVISLLGNHELMNVAGKMQYVSYMGLLDFSPNVDLSKMTINNKDEYSKFTSEGLNNRRKAFTNNNNTQEKPLNKFLACTRTSSIIIGDLLFVHGGFTPIMAESYDMDHLNKIVRIWLLGKLTDELTSSNEYKNLLKTKEENATKKVSFNFKERLNTLLNSGSKGASIFWNRLLGHIVSDIDIKDLSEKSKNEIIEKCDINLKPVFKILNINGMIIGHTPQMNKEYGINSTCNERVWRIDIGASGAFDSFRNSVKRDEVLEIVHENNKNIYKILDKSNIIE